MTTAQKFSFRIFSFFVMSDLIINVIAGKRSKVNICGVLTACGGGKLSLIMNPLVIQ